MKQNYTNNNSFRLNVLFSTIKGLKRTLGVNKAVLVFLLFFVQAVVVAQSIGDYKSNTTSGDWKVRASWLRYDGNNWVLPTVSEGYPGQNAGTGVVLIQAGNTITIDSGGISTVQMGTVTISGTLNLIGLNNTQIDFSINTNSIVVSSGGTIHFEDKVKLILPANASLLATTGGLSGDCSNNQDIFIGSSIYAVCTGGGGTLNFPQVMTSGGTLNTTISTNTPLCENETVKFFGGISNTGWTISNYSWSIAPPSGATITASSQNVTVTNGLLGTYTATLSVTAKYGSSSSYTNTKTISFVVDAKPIAPIITAGGATTFCTGGSVSLTSSAGTSYLWSTGATTQSINATTSGSYTVQVSNGSGCQSASSAGTTVTVNALPTITGILNVCAGSTTALMGSGIANASTPWTSGTPSVATVSNSGVVSGVASGTSIITYKNNNGCTITATVTVNALPTIIGTLNVCAGSTTALTGSGTAAATAPWTSSTPSVATVSNSGVISGVASGTSIITYKNNNGCTITATVTVNALPTITGTLNVCAGSTTALTGSGTAAATAPWTSGTPSVATVSNSGVISGVASGTSIITYKNNNGCTITATVIVNALPIVAVNGPIEINCTNTTAALNGTGSISGANITYLWSTLDGTFSGATNAITATATAAGTYKLTVTNTTTGCSDFKTVAVTLNQTKPTVVVNAAQVITCTNTTAALNGTGSTSGANITYLWSTLDGTFSGATNAITATATAAGTYKLTVTNTTTGCSEFKTVAVTLNQTKPTVVVNAAQVITCTNTTAALNGTGSATSGVTYAWSTADGTFSGAKDAITAIATTAGIYTLTVTKTDTGCFDSKTVSVTKNIPINTWDGIKWSDGTPTSSQEIKFTGGYDIDADVNGCSCKVTGSKDVTIKSGKTMKIVNEVEVLGSGKLIFENNASLVQINDGASNSGKIVYNRKTPKILNTDYIYWSSPVDGFTLGDITQGTLYYEMNAAGTGWIRRYAGNIMEKAVGYIVRGEGTGLNSGTLFDKTVAFIGTPNNGRFSANIGGAAGAGNLIGNPYPSAIDADLFLMANTNSEVNDVLQGTLYFWTHNTEIQLATGLPAGTAGSGKYAYTSNDYAAYNFTGGTGTAPSKEGIGYNGGMPNGIIAAGQSFLATSNGSGGVAKFENSMRLDSQGKTLYNSLFFKPAAISNKEVKVEKSRVWLNLTNEQGAFKQTLVGYLTGATNNYDRGYDGKNSNANSFVNFYSINNNTNFTIQGRALPIEDTEIVPLGYSSKIAGDFSISIEKTDGLLADMIVYVEDKLINTKHNLKDGPYKFNTQIGTFNERFLLTYKSNVTLGTADLIIVNSGVAVSSKNKEIKIQSPSELISHVTLYDISGKLIAEKTKVNALELLFSNIAASKQVILVKVTLENGQTISKKIVY